MLLTLYADSDGLHPIGTLSIVSLNGRKMLVTVADQGGTNIRQAWFESEAEGWELVRDALEEVACG